MNDSRSPFGLLTARRARPMAQRVYKLSWPPKDFTLGGTGLDDCAVKWGCLANKSANSRRQPILLIPCPWRRISLVRSLRRRSPTKSGPVITYIATDEGWLYLAGLKDVFTCEIVGYAMGERMTTGLVSQALFRAVQQKRPPVGLIHHTDRGSQYCAKAYRALQVQFGMQTSMSRKGNCFDNAPIESFWGSLKNELVHHHRFETRAEAKAAIQEYIEIFYNRQRRHSRLGNVSPAEFNKRYWRTAQAA